MKVSVAPYLFFDGNCEQVLKFYQTALGGDLRLQRYSNLPSTGDHHQVLPNDWNDKILHGSLFLPTNNNELLLMACDHREKGKVHGGYSLSVSVDDPEQGQHIFKALSEGGKVLMKYDKTFWARGYGMLEDQFGITWQVNCH
nr:unnamed protein product [Naegleria fowleri]